MITTEYQLIRSENGLSVPVLPSAWLLILAAISWMNHLRLVTLNWFEGRHRRVFILFHHSFSPFKSPRRSCRMYSSLDLRVSVLCFCP